MINAGDVRYIDAHLSHSAQHMWFGFYGKLDVAVVEVDRGPAGRVAGAQHLGGQQQDLARPGRAGTPRGQPLAAASSWRASMTSTTAPQLPPSRRPIMLTEALQRIGEPYLHVDRDKVVAVIETHAPTATRRSRPPTTPHRRSPGTWWTSSPRDPRGTDAAGAAADPVRRRQRRQRRLGRARRQRSSPNLVAFTEVLQDGMLDLLDSGTLRAASATSFGLSSDGVRRFIGRHRRLQGPHPAAQSGDLQPPGGRAPAGVLAMNGMIEADIYGNVNSTHIMGSAIMNGIGGSGDFARNGFCSFFLSPSTAKGGAISAIVPMVSHVDHTEHDVDVVVTEQGLADLRGLAPRDRVPRIIEGCAHPSFRDPLRDYFDRALAARPNARHTPHLLDEALSWHQRYLDTGSMLPELQVAAPSCPQIGLVPAVQFGCPGAPYREQRPVCAHPRRQRRLAARRRRPRLARRSRPTARMWRLSPSRRNTPATPARRLPSPYLPASIMEP